MLLWHERLHMTWTRRRREKFFYENDNLCSYCFVRLSYRDSCLDRVIPPSDGGAYTAHNVVLCCQRCNIDKSNRSLLIFLLERPSGIMHGRGRQKHPDPLRVIDVTPTEENLRRAPTIDVARYMRIGELLNQGVIPRNGRLWDWLDFGTALA